MIRTTLLILMFSLVYTAHASERIDYSLEDMEEAVPVVEYLPESVAASKRYGDFEFNGFEWFLIITGTILFNVGVWKLDTAEATTSKKVRLMHWCFIVIGFVCLYPCLFGLYYNFIKGGAHVLGFALCLLPYIIYELKRRNIF